MIILIVKVFLQELLRHEESQATALKDPELNNEEVILATPISYYVPRDNNKNTACDVFATKKRKVIHILFSNYNYNAQKALVFYLLNCNIFIFFKTNICDYLYMSLECKFTWRIHFMFKKRKTF